MRDIIDKPLVRVTWHLGNWTFGFWTGMIGRRRMYGIDLGPLEAVFKSRGLRR